MIVFVFVCCVFVCGVVGIVGSVVMVGLVLSLVVLLGWPLFGLGWLVLGLWFVSRVLAGLVGVGVVFHVLQWGSMVPVLTGCCWCGILGLDHVIIGDFVEVHSWSLERFVLVEVG